MIRAHASAPCEGRLPIAAPQGLTVRCRDRGTADFSLSIDLIHATQIPADELKRPPWDRMIGKPGRARIRPERICSWTDIVVCMCECGPLHTQLLPCVTDCIGRRACGARINPASATHRIIRIETRKSMPGQRQRAEHGLAGSKARSAIGRQREAFCACRSSWHADECCRSQRDRPRDRFHSPPHSAPIERKSLASLRKLHTIRFDRLQRSIEVKALSF